MAKSIQSDVQAIRRFQAVERKGLGHPDTIADLLADEFSRLYSKHCLEKFGLILNHWVDKVNVVGSVSNVRWGGFEISKPISVYLFGKITSSVGLEIIDITEIFERAVRRILVAATACSSIMQHVRLVIENAAGVQLDHDKSFYWPTTGGDAGDALQRETRANDTVLCSAYARSDDVTAAAFGIETMLTDRQSLGDCIPFTGNDVKVCLVLEGDTLSGAICIPLHPDQVSSRRVYDEILDEVSARLHHYVKDVFGDRYKLSAPLRINTKDTESSVYLAPFGTALGKGDCGVVGRGNRINGVINVLEPSTCEAPAGKNPLHHVGKLYTLGAQLIADDLVRAGCDHVVVLLGADNGRPLTDPSCIYIEGASAVRPVDVDAIVEGVISRLPHYWRYFVNSDPVETHRKGAAAMFGQAWQVIGGPRADRRV